MVEARLPVLRRLSTELLLEARGIFAGDGPTLLPLLDLVSVEVIELMDFGEIVSRPGEFTPELKAKSCEILQKDSKV